MNRILAILAFLGLAVSGFAQTNFLTGNVGDYGLAPGSTNVACTLTLLSPKHRVVNGIFVRDEPTTVHPDVSGAFTFTNIIYGRYQFTISGVYGSAWTVTVNTNTTGTVPLGSLALPPNTVAAPLPDPATNYYTMPQVDALLANLPGGGGGSATNVSGGTFNNVTLHSSTIDGTVTGNGNGLTNLNPNNITGVPWADASTATNIANFQATNEIAKAGLATTGSVNTAVASLASTSFVNTAVSPLLRTNGDGSGLTNINATNVNGTLPVASLPLATNTQGGAITEKQFTAFGAVPYVNHKAPMLYFETWALLNTNLTESAVLSVATNMITYGYLTNGYKGILLDEPLLSGHDSSGHPYASSNRFPHGMPWLTSQLRGLGITNIGVFASLGAHGVAVDPDTGFDVIGHAGYVDTDGAYMATNWGINFFHLVVDDYGWGDGANYQLYRRFIASVRQTGSDVTFQGTVHEWEPWLFGELGGGLLWVWPNYKDSLTIWPRVVEFATNFPTYSGAVFPGHYLMYGWAGATADTNYVTTANQLAAYKSSLGMLSMWHSPLAVANIYAPGGSPDWRSVQCNSGMLQINQDSGAFPPFVITNNGALQVWSEPAQRRDSNARYIAFANKDTNSTLGATVTWAQLGLPPGSYTVTNIWNSSGFVDSTNSLTATAAPYTTEIYQIFPQVQASVSSLPSIIAPLGISDNGTTWTNGGSIGQNWINMTNANTGAAFWMGPVLDGAYSAIQLFPDTVFSYDRSALWGNGSQTSLGVKSGGSIYFRNGGTILGSIDSAGKISGNGNGITNIQASNITGGGQLPLNTVSSGLTSIAGPMLTTNAGARYYSFNGGALTNIGPASLASSGGTPSSSTFYRGDGQWGAPAGSGDVSQAAQNNFANSNSFAGATLFSGRVYGLDAMIAAETLTNKVPSSNVTFQAANYIDGSNALAWVTVDVNTNMQVATNAFQLITNNIQTKGGLPAGLVSSGTNNSANVGFGNITAQTDIRAANQMYAQSFNGNLTGNVSGNVSGAGPFFFYGDGNHTNAVYIGGNTFTVSNALGSVTISNGNVTASGDVTAATFHGNGAGLSGVSGGSSVSGMPEPFNQHWTYATFNGSSGTAQIIGDLFSTISSPSAVAPTATAPSHGLFPVAATTGSSGGYDYGTGFWANKNGYCHNRIAITNVTNVRVYVGLASNPDSSDYASTDFATVIDSRAFALFRASTGASGASDTNWKCITSNGSTSTVTDSGLPIAAETWVSLDVQFVGTSSVIFLTNGVACCTNTTTLPNATANAMRATARVTTLENAAKGLRLEQVYTKCDP